jgi:hypothetical protein
MGSYYRFVDRVTTGDRTEVIRVEDAVFDPETGDTRPAKEMRLNGDAVELNDDQVQKLARFAVLEPADPPSASEPPIVDQPLIESASMSTAVPPRLGTTPDLSEERKDDLIERAQAVGIETSGMNKEELRTALEDHYATKGA